MKIENIYKIFKKVLFTPKSIFLVLKDETEYEKYLMKKYKKKEFPTVDIRKFIEDEKLSCDFTFLNGGSLITDLILLKALAKKTSNCNYLEIGMWRGESSINVADVAAHCTSINLSKQDIIAYGWGEKYAKLHGCLIKNQSNIKIIEANSLNFDFNSLNEKYDLIFIDGNHSYEAVKSDTKNVFNLLKDENSIIVWHDYAYNPEEPRYSVISAILDGLPLEEHKNLYHVSNTMCAIYTRKKMEAKKLDTPVAPDKLFKIELTAFPFECCY